MYEDTLAGHGPAIFHVFGNLGIVVIIGVIFGIGFAVGVLFKTHIDEKDKDT